MQTYEGSDCAATLLDLICYEKHGERLSLEVEALLERHLDECASCRRRFSDFHEVAFSREVAYHH